jgi:uncharacterized Zn-binding protein involved in type VI secretion
MLTEAARFNSDQIEHSSGWLASLGMAILAVVVVVVIVGTGGLAAMGAIAAIGLLTTAFGFGKAISDFSGLPKASFWPKYSAGPIKEHSPDTLIEGKYAARVYDKVDCHSGKKVATGCKTIFINMKPATRKDEKTECAGKIKTGAGSCWYGGPSEEYLKVADEEAIPDWLWWTYEVIDWVGFFTGFKGFGAKLMNLRNLGNLYDVADKAISLGSKFIEGTFGEYYERVTGNPAPTTGIFAKQGFTDSNWYKGAKLVWAGIGLGKDVAEARGGRPATQQNPDSAPASTGDLPAQAPRASGPSDASSLPSTAPRPSGLTGDTPTTVPGPAPRVSPAPSGDPPGWADTAAAIARERRGEVQLPDWHERMVGSRGE